MTNNGNGPSVENAIFIARSAAEVWEFLTDVANDAQWVSGTASARWSSDPPHGVGSTGVRVMEDSTEWPFKIVEWEESHVASWDVTGGQGEGIRSGYRIASEGDGSRVTLIVGMKAGVIPSLLMPIVKKNALRQLNSNLENLKAVLES